jgi:Co/Zn/Cd efflux system component
MSGQCCQNQPKFDGVSAEFKRALWIVIVINGVMFVVEMIAGRISQSQSLQADALDFFADTITYGLSLYVIGMSIKVRSSAALLKGFSLAGMGLWVLGSTVYQSFLPSLPQAEVMGLIGFLALLANSLSVLLLIRYRNGDANVRSAWLCSRNDAIGNIAVMLAGSGVWVTNSAWPDLVVASLMAGLFLWSAVQILRLAYEEYQSSVRCF